MRLTVGLPPLNQQSDGRPIYAGHHKEKNMRKNFLRTSVLIFTVIIVWLLTFMVVNADRFDENILDTQTTNQMMSIQNELDIVSDPEHQNSLQAKLNTLQYQADIQATGQKMAPEKPADICASMPKSTFVEEVRPTGILPGAPGPFSSQVLKVENQWQDQLNGYWMNLYAGVSGLDSNQGGVILWIEDVESGGFFSDPEPEGALTILSVHGTRLELLTSEGTTRYFDILAQQFIPDLKSEVNVVELPASYVFDPCGQDR
jgi:hypothetical protein